MSPHTINPRVLLVSLVPEAEGVVAVGVNLCYSKLNMWLLALLLLGARRGGSGQSEPCCSSCQFRLVLGDWSGVRIEAEALRAQGAALAFRQFQDFAAFSLFDRRQEVGRTPSGRQNGRRWDWQI